MNNFKHIFGVNIPCRASSNAALSYYGQHTDVYFENRQFSRRSQLSKSNSLFVTKKSHGIGIKYSGQFPQNGLRLVSKGSRTIFKQRNRTKSSVISLQKKSSVDKTLENITGIACHYYSTCQNAKLNNNFISKRHVSQNAIKRNTAKNISHNSSSLAFIEKHPRSYAEIIADYSKALYKKSTNTQNDSLYFNNIIRQSPFSSSMSPLNKKLVCATEHDGIPTEKQENHSISLCDDCNSINQPHRQENINITECHNFQHYDTYANKIMNRSTNQEYVTPSDFKNEDQSYEKLVSDCSKSMQISLASTLKPGLIPSKNVLTRNSHEIFGTPTRKASSTNMQGTLQKTIPTIATMPLGRSIKEQTSDSKENDWLREIESVISDLRSASERKTARAVNVLKLRESRILQSADASSDALDRIQKLAELIKVHKQKEKNTADKKLGESKYFSNTAKSLSSRKNVTQVPIVSGTASTLKQPQVELRMVPSEKESVVSINVDSASIGLSQDPVNPASKQLSVVVQSDRKEDQQPNETQWSTSTLRSDTKSASQRNDFGPMRISISEDSAPVKQIEFSINGKPVSELKSITARTERLDVVSSMDKIEIRIPFAKDDASSKTGGGDLSKQTDSSGGPILNVQIAANFQPGKSSGGRSVGIINTTPISSQIPRTHYAFNDPAETLGSVSAQQHGSSTWSDIRSDNTIEEQINEDETSDNVNLKIQHATTKKLSTDKTMVDVSLIKKATDTKVGKWNTKKMTSTVSSETNKYDKNESSDPRVPSKVIPWWSSSDSFSKIRKKDDDRKPVAPTLNRNENKAVFNMNQDLAIQSFSSKSKETSSPKLQTKNADSMHDATTNNSNDLISHVDSVEQYKISKPSDLYSFKQEPNRANSNIIPKMRTDNLKTENIQTSDIKEDNKNFSKIRQIIPLTLSTLGTTNKQNKCDVSIEEKVSISPKSVKMLNGQNLPLKKEQHSLEQTNSTDDASSMKSRIEKIINTIKPIEKRKDGILIDYGSKKLVPRKPIVKLNNGMEENQNAIIKKRRNLTSDKYDEIRQNMKHNINATKTIPKRQQINKKMSAEQTEVNETKKAEIKMNILKKKEDLRVKNIATTDFKEQNKNDMKKNIKNMHNNDTTTSNSSNFRDSSKLTQTLKKHEKLVEDTMQDNSTQTLKLLPKFNTSNHLSSTWNSSETIPKSKHQLGTLIKISSEEPKQDKQKYLSSIRNIPSRTNIEESEKLNNLTSLKSKDNHHLSKEFSNKKVVEIPTKSDKDINKIVNTDKSYATQTKSNPTLKTSQSKNSTVSKETVNKNAKAMPITNKKNDMVENMVENTVAKIITQNPKIRSSLPKDSEDNHLHKSKSSRNKKNSSELDSAKKTDGSTGSKTSDSKICVISREQSIEFCPRPHQILKIRNPNNVNSISEHVPSLIRSIGPDIDRPEKKELYSVWLQQPKNDNDEKLF